MCGPSDSAWQLLGAHMRLLREGAGVSLSTAAAALGYSKGHLSLVERGRDRPSMALVQRYDAEYGGDGLLYSLFTLARVPDHTGVASMPIRALPGDESVFVADVTIPDGTLVEPGQRLEKIWRIRNTGTVPWHGRQLVRQGPTDGRAVLASRRSTPLPDAQPGAEIEICVPIRAPMLPGTCYAVWKTAGRDGSFCYPGLEYGLTVLVTVADDRVWSSPNGGSRT